MHWPTPDRICLRLGLLALLVSLALVACAPARRFDLPPVTIRSDGSVPPTADQSIIPDLPPGELFASGFSAFQAGDREMALRWFTALVERHPEAPEFADGAYNAGLLLQRFDRHAEAAQRFRQVISVATDSRDITDARFRLLVSLHELAQWEESLVQVDALADARLPLDDALEVRMRRGVALLHLDKPEEAREILEATFYDYEIGIRRDQVINEIPGAMAAFYLGMVHRGRFDRAPLTLGDHSLMMAQMEQRAQHLQDAQGWFLKSIQQDNVTWATASGLQIGALYRDFFRAIREVPTPPELADEDEVLMYRCMLFDQVKVLLRKAMRVYEHTLDIGLRLRVRNRFIEQTREDLREVESLYLAEEKRCTEVLPGRPTPGSLSR